MASFRELIVKIGADTGGLENGLTSAVGSLTGLSSTAVAVSAVGVAALAALGAAAFKVGLDFEESSKTIRAGTGATGAELEDLEASAKGVFGQVDESIGEVSKTLADLNTATGATGPTLEKLTEQMLDLTDLGVGFSGEVTNLTRVYGDWRIAIEDAAEANDYLFKVAQSTGIGVDDLANKIVQFGAPMRQLGFDFEESAALMGEWHKKGVNTETVMAGMRIGLANLSEAGGDVPAAFQAAIESIENAGTTAEANSIAFEIFGKRAGADMAAAIRDGRFSLDELMATLDASGDTIASVAKETETFGEKFSTVFNKAMAFVEPLGSALVDGLGAGLDTANDAITAAGDSWDTWSEKLGGLNADLGELKGELFPVTEWVYSFEEAVGLTKGTIDEAREATKQWQLQLASDAWDKAGSAIGWLVENHLKPYRDTLEIIQAKSNAKNTFGDVAAIKAVADATNVGAEGLAVFAAQQASAGEEVKKAEQEVTDLGASSKKAAKDVFDLQKALAASEREAADFEKGLEAARERGVEEFAKAIDVEAVPELEDLDRVSGQTANAMLSDLLAMAGGVDPLVVKLEEIPRRTKDVEAAFDSLESQSVGELESLYRQAEKNFDLIQESGEATPRQISEAWRIELEAQKALLVAQGQDLSAEEQKILDDLNAKLSAGVDQMEGTWSQFATSVGATVSQLGEDLFSDLLEGKFSVDTVLGALGSIKDAFADALFKPVSAQINKFITESIDKLIGKLTGPGGVSGALDKVFGGGGGAADAATGAAGGAASAGGAAASTAGGVASAASSVFNPINTIANVGSLISGVVSNFQLAKQETTLNAIEESVRRSEIHLGGPAGILNSMHTYLASDEWNRHGDLKNHLTSISDRISSDSWQQNANIWSRMDSNLPGIKSALEANTSASSTMLAAVVAALNDLKAIAARPVEVKLNEQKVGESVSEYLGAQI